MNAADHREPYPGDHGLRFDPRPGLAADEWKESDHPRGEGGRFSRSGGNSGTSKHLELNIGGRPFTVEVSAGKPVSVTEYQDAGSGHREAKVLWRRGENSRSSYYERAIEQARQENPEEFSEPTLPEISSENVRSLSLADIEEAKREVNDFRDHIFEQKLDPEEVAAEILRVQELRNLLKSEIIRREEVQKETAREKRRAEPVGQSQKVVAATHEWGKVRGGLGYTGSEEEIEPLWQKAAFGTQHLLDAAREAGYSDHTIGSVFSALRGQGHSGSSEEDKQSEVVRIAEGDMGPAEQSLLRAIGEHQARAEGVRDKEFYRKGSFHGQPVISTTTSESGASMAVGQGKFRSIGWDQKRSGRDLLREGYLPFGTTYTQGYLEEHETLWVKFPRSKAEDAVPKKSKAQADYTDHASDPHHQCHLCEHFVSPNGCERVQGAIDPKGWCEMWHARAAEDSAMATDPPVSEAQRRAMWAAASGHSNIGIPEKVGREFAEADPGGKLPSTARDMTRSGWRRIMEGLAEMAKFFGEEEEEPEHQGEDAAEPTGRAAAVAFVTPDGRVLLTRRSKTEENYPGHWSLPGGRAEGDETHEDAARRECREELGDCGLDEMRPLGRTRTSRGFDHVTFTAPVREPFDPELNDEHDTYGWFPIDDLPEKIHPGVQRTLGESYDRIPAVDRSRKASDEMPWFRPMAIDKAIRTPDDSGRMHVTDSVLSKAVVSPYLGHEINEVMRDEPGWQKLEPDRRYHLLRDPRELEKAKDTFNGLPLLWVHKATSAEDHPHEIVIGSTGTRAKYSNGDLTNDLVIWPKYATQAVENGDRRSLSCGYGYRAVMEPGTHDGQRYDGRMVDIKGNHVALVDQPRVPGAEVGGDSADELLWRELASAICGLAA